MRGDVPPMARGGLGEIRLLMLIGNCIPKFGLSTEAMSLLSDWYHM